MVERLEEIVFPERSGNNEIGLPLTVLRADEHTRYLVLEMAARGPGHIAALCDIARPRIGAVLNVGRAHAGEFGSLETVAKAKGETVEALPASGAAILNADDPRVLAMADRTEARVVTFSTAGAAGPATGTAPGTVADVRAAGIVLDDLGRPSFQLVLPAGAAPVTLRLHGAHNVANALAAAAIAAEVGWKWRPSRTLSRRRLPAAPSAWRSVNGPTASWSSTTLTTRTRSPCGPGSRRSAT